MVLTQDLALSFSRDLRVLGEVPAQELSGAMPPTARARWRRRRSLMRPAAASPTRLPPHGDPR